MRRWICCLLLLGACWCQAYAGEETQKTPTPPTPPELLDRAAMLEAAKEITREKYPNADEVLVGNHVRVSYQADGAYVQWHEEYLKILTEKSKRAHQTVSSYFTIPYQQPDGCAIPVLEIIKPDGETKVIDAMAKSKVMINPGSMSANIYNTNDKIRQVAVPGLEIGDVLHFVMYDRVGRARMKNSFNDFFVFESTRPLLSMTVEIDGPTSLPLKSLALQDTIEGTVKAIPPKTEDGRIHYRWEVHDVPRMFPEPNAPSYWNYVQRLLVSTCPDWPYVSRWYWNLSEPHYKPSEAMKEKVAELTAQTKTRAEKIEAVFTWVSQNIRYLSVTEDNKAPGYEPQDVSLTFERRRGVCRDKAALLVSMLRVAGLEAFPVLIHNGPKKDPEVPQPYFNHAISAVREADGNYILMDSTDENTKQLLPAYLNDQSYLVATPQGDTLRVAPAEPATKNMLFIETNGRIDDQGSLTVESILKFEGFNDNVYRGYFSRITPVERRRYFEGAVKDVAAGARLTECIIEPEDMRDTSRSLQVRLRYEADGILVESEGLAMLPVPQLGTRVGMVNFALRRTGLEKRRFPLLIDVACGVQESLRIRLPEQLGSAVAMPVYPPLESDTVTWKQSLAVVGQNLVGSGTFKLKVPEFSPKQYLALKETLTQMEYNARRMPIFERKSDAHAGNDDKLPTDVDVVVLEETVDYAVESETAWTETRSVRKKILTYAGMKDHSELTLRYNPAWEEVKVERAAVTGADGKIRTISEKELSLMDAGWVGKAPRYPAGKTLVASLPGVEVGSVIDYRIVRKVKDRPFFATRESFRHFEPVLRKTVTADLPKGLKLKALVTGAAADEKVLKHQAADKDGRVIHTWVGQDLESVKRESSLPPWYIFTPTLFLSSGDWSEYAATLQGLLTSAASEQAAAVSKAKELTADTGDMATKVRRIRDFVAMQIQAAGPALDEVPLTAATPADQTLKEGYGNTTDRAVLLHAMLAGAGAEPAFVFASWGSQVPALQEPLKVAPHPETFPVVLVRVQVGKQTVYLNDTDQYAELGTTYHDGRLGLALETGKLLTIRAPEEMHNRDMVRYVIRLQEDGEALITKKRLFFGTRYAAARKRFAEMPPEERKRYFQEAVSSISQGATPEVELKTEFERYPGLERFTVRVQKFAVRDGQFLYLTLPDSLRSLFWLRSDTRENPLYWSAPVHEDIETLLVLPPGMRIAKILPPALEWRAPGEAGVVTVQTQFFTPEGSRVTMSTASRDLLKALQDGNAVLHVAHKADLAPTVVPAANYATLLAIDSKLDHLNARTVLLAGAKPVVAKPTYCTLALQADGTVTLEGKPVASKDLAATLQNYRAQHPEAVIVIEPHADAKAGAMLKIMETVKAAGFKGMKIEREKKEPAEK